MNKPQGEIRKIYLEFYAFLQLLLIREEINFIYRSQWILQNSSLNFLTTTPKGKICPPHSLAAPSLKGPHGLPL